MADNATPTGSGVNVATDEVTIGGAPAQVQFVKIVDATADSTNRLVIDAQGAAMTRSEPMSTGTNTSVTSAAANTVILTNDQNRRRAILYNDSTSVCRVACGFTASATAFTYLMDPGGTVVTDFDGAINAIWATANGFMRVTAMS